MSSPGNLVRDGKRAIVEAKGERHGWHQASREEYRRLLARKLGEECGEARDAAIAGDRDALASELADVIEVVLALGAAHGIDAGEIRNRAVIKKAREGGYGGLVWDGPADVDAEQATRVYEAAKVLQYHVP